MSTKHRRTRALCAAMLVVALAMLGLAGSASAKLTGYYTNFDQCPFTNTEVRRCIKSTTVGGTVVLGSKKVPIVNPVVLQGGFGPADEVTEFSKFYAAKNGVTLSKAAQPVPGGLAGLVNCKEISNFLLRVSCEVTFENGLTGVNSVLELAKPASAIKISESHLAEQSGVALEMPVKFHLENPFLGGSCYVGSEASPVLWKLTTATTSPPAPNTPITGKVGELELYEEGGVLSLTGNEMVDNSWAAPSTNGCGGIFSFILDPIVSASSGLPSAAGKNTAILKNNIFQAPRVLVNLNNEENP